jgi:hypothetical protein
VPMPPGPNFRLSLGMTGVPTPYRPLIDDRKITHHLLSSIHPAGRAKAVFFRRFGFGIGMAEFT